MAKIEDLVLRLSLDTTNFDKQMAKAKRRLWWIQVQHQLLFGFTVVMAFLLGFVVGINV